MISVKHRINSHTGHLFLDKRYADTGNLTFPATTAEDALAAAYRLQQGADLSVLASFLRPAYGENQRTF